jgi:mannose-6-phosphate isomerase class I
MHDLEAEFDKVTQMRTSFFGFTKKAKAKKEAEATQKLNFAKGELEIAVQNFAVEQEKMQDEYEKKKQDTIAMVQTLEKEIVDIEEDSSLEARQATSAALANAVKDLLHRRSVPSQ